MFARVQQKLTQNKQVYSVTNPETIVGFAGNPNMVKVNDVITISGTQYRVSSRLGADQIGIVSLNGKRKDFSSLIQLNAIVSVEVQADTNYWGNDIRPKHTGGMLQGVLGNKRVWSLDIQHSIPKLLFEIYCKHPNSTGELHFRYCTKDM
jgi:hypothetical protein